MKSLNFLKYKWELLHSWEMYKYENYAQVS